MKRSEKFWITIGIIFTIWVNIIAWPHALRWGQLTDGQCLLCAMSIIADIIVLIMFFIFVVPVINKFIDKE